MKKVLWAALAVLLAVSCGKAVTAEPEKPLELTAKNIEGKWVLEGDSSVWFEFKSDKTYTKYENNSLVDFDGKFEILDKETIKRDWKNKLSVARTDTAKLTLYSNYFIFYNAKYKKTKE